MIEARPTLYNGIRLRSRLEARWACMFDELGWQWEYEPFDLTGWTPDFLLHGKTPILVEVKPLVEIRTDAPLPAECKKIERGFKDYDVMLVGISPRIVNGNYGLGWNNAIGWMFDRDYGEVGGACLAECGDIYHDTGSYAFRRSGLHDGDHHLTAMSSTEIDHRWAIAINATQWAAKQEAKAAGEEWRRKIRGLVER